MYPYRLIYLNVNLYSSLYILDAIGRLWWWTVDEIKLSTMILLVEMEFIVLLEYGKYYLKLRNLVH